MAILAAGVANVIFGGLRPDICSLLGALLGPNAPSTELSFDFHVFDVSWTFLGSSWNHSGLSGIIRGSLAMVGVATRQAFG